MPQHRSLTSLAHKTIRDMVLSGEIAPGSRIQIDVLRSKLDMGASPVREALSILSSEQLVLRTEQRGFRAAEISAEDFNTLVQTRCRLEGYALQDSIRLGDNAWKEGIVVLQYRLAGLSRETATTEWEDTHHDFHRALIAACPSGYLLKFCSQLYDLNVRYRNIAKLAAYPARKIEDEHARLAEATLNRDADLAVNLLTEHYQRTGEFVYRKLSEQEKQQNLEAAAG